MPMLLCFPSHYTILYHVILIPLSQTVLFYLGKDPLDPVLDPAIWLPLLSLSFPFFNQENNKRRTFELVLLLPFHLRPWESSPKTARSSVRKCWGKSKVLLSPGTEAFQQTGGSCCSFTPDCHNPCSHQRPTPFSFLEESSGNAHIPQLSCLADELCQKMF